MKLSYLLLVFLIFNFSFEIEASDIAKIAKLEKSIEKKEAKIERINKKIEKHQEKVDKKKKWWWWSWARIKALKLDRWRLKKLIKSKRKKLSQLESEDLVKTIDDVNKEVAVTGDPIIPECDDGEAINKKEVQLSTPLFTMTQEKIIIQNAKGSHAIQSCLPEVKDGESKKLTQGRKADYRCTLPDGDSNGYIHDQMSNYKIKKENGIFTIEAKLKLNFPDGQRAYTEPKILNVLPRVEAYYRRHGLGLKLIIVNELAEDVHDISIRREGIIGSYKTVNALNWVTDRAYSEEQKAAVDEGRTPELPLISDSKLVTFLAHEITHWFGVGDTYHFKGENAPICPDRPKRGTVDDLKRGEQGYLMGYSWMDQDQLILHDDEIKRIIEPLCKK